MIAARRPGHLRGELRINEAMARHTSWRVGGPADRWYRPADLDDLVLFLSGLRADEPLFWLGLGSNILVRDGGIRGTVIAYAGVLDTLHALPGYRVRVGAGVSCAKLSRFCAEHDLAGGEFLAGIPGALGGALAMNAGAWGDDTWSHVEQVTTIDRRGCLQVHTRGDYEVGYRHVQGSREGWFVEATLAFAAGDGEESRRRVKDLLSRRNRTQPIGQPSCGSVFRNPPGDHAARLIEAAGLKGMRIGGAMVSERHANFIINTGTARAADMEALMHRVQTEIHARFGVELVPEVRIVGESVEEVVS
ncbi:UDP-N-acetylmuramate dehydrogenase [Ectothiorhodospira shaposhnikovii]|uniref:UDP-N-acetylmuramate dehydrogenase n=1 Tax=Ectothiorhodospira shaposhnikovii TaxID=1054 RepID=UPI001EE7B9CE|nr:UDP-N-acetylmuramate dehydrogenase [Ectothiorhodospira shaposhnikovii]MCG5513444.1 UDP-N-acetylmuramate dehydrogenase [Ectothiorhodospira shaposhnikovii]